MRDFFFRSSSFSKAQEQQQQQPFVAVALMAVAIEPEGGDRRACELRFVVRAAAKLKVSKFQKEILDSPNKVHIF